MYQNPFCCNVEPFHPFLVGIIGIVNRPDLSHPPWHFHPQGFHRCIPIINSSCCLGEYLTIQISQRCCCNFPSKLSIRVISKIFPSLIGSITFVRLLSILSLSPVLFWAWYPQILNQTFFFG